METKALRVFYRKSNNQIVWTHELRGTGKFPTTITQDLAEIPDKIISRELDADGSVIGETRVGGVVQNYSCIEEQDSQRASNALLSDNNKISNGKLIIGSKRVIVEHQPPRDLLAEIDELKARLDKAGVA